MKNDDLQLFAAKEKHARKIKRRSGRDESDVDEYDDSSVEVILILCVFSQIIPDIFKLDSTKMEVLSRYWCYLLVFRPALSFSFFSNDKFDL